MALSVGQPRGAREQQSLRKFLFGLDGNQLAHLLGELEFVLVLLRWFLILNSFDCPTCFWLFCWLPLWLLWSVQQAGRWQKLPRAAPCCVALSARGLVLELESSDYCPIL